MDLPVEADSSAVDVIVAGELIEHLSDTSEFLASLRKNFCGKELLLTTPNATSITNVLIAFAARESSHHDHLQIYSYKTLNTLFLRAGFTRWEIVPYCMQYTEMSLRYSGFKKVVVQSAQRGINAVEKIFPLLAGGLIGHVHKL